VIQNFSTSKEVAPHAVPRGKLDQKGDDDESDDISWIGAIASRKVEILAFHRAESVQTLVPP